MDEEESSGTTSKDRRENNSNASTIVHDLNNIPPSAGIIKDEVSSSDSIEIKHAASVHLEGQNDVDDTMEKMETNLNDKQGDNAFCNSSVLLTDMNSNHEMKNCSSSKESNKICEVLTEIKEEVACMDEMRDLSAEGRVDVNDIEEKEEHISARIVDKLKTEVEKHFDVVQTLQDEASVIVEGNRERVLRNQDHNESCETDLKGNAVLETVSSDIVDAEKSEIDCVLTTDPNTLYNIGKESAGSVDKEGTTENVDSTAIHSHSENVNLTSQKETNTNIGVVSTDREQDYGCETDNSIMLNEDMRSVKSNSVISTDAELGNADKSVESGNSVDTHMMTVTCSESADSKLDASESYSQRGSIEKLVEEERIAKNLEIALKIAPKVHEGPEVNTHSNGDDLTILKSSPKGENVGSSKVKRKRKRKRKRTEAKVKKVSKENDMGAIDVELTVPATSVDTRGSQGNTAVGYSATSESETQSDNKNSTDVNRKMEKHSHGSGETIVSVESAARPSTMSVPCAIEECVRKDQHAGQPDCHEGFEKQEAHDIREEIEYLTLSGDESDGVMKVANESESVLDTKKFWHSYFNKTLENFVFYPKFEVVDYHVLVIEDNREEPLAPGVEIQQPFWIELPPWFQIIFPAGSNLMNYEKWINLYIMEICTALSLSFYKSYEDRVELFTDDADQVHLLHTSTRNHYFISNNEIKSIHIVPLFSYSPSFTISLKRNIEVAVKNRWDAPRRCLDLENFHKSADLVNLDFCPVDDKEVFRCILKIIERNCLQVEILNLKFNGIMDLEFLTLGEKCLQNLKQINLCNNRIRYLSQLKPLKIFRITDLSLNFNPIKGGTEALSSEYFRYMKKYVPYLEVLDGSTMVNIMSQPSEIVNTGKIPSHVSEVSVKEQNVHSKEQASNDINIIDYNIDQTASPLSNIPKNILQSKETKEVSSVPISDTPSFGSSHTVAVVQETHPPAKIDQEVIAHSEETEKTCITNVDAEENAVSESNRELNKLNNKSEIETGLKSDTAKPDDSKSRYKLPSSKSRFFIADNPMVKEFMENFVNLYFSVFDSKDRSLLADLYHENALFSISTVFLPGQITSSGARLVTYTVMNRNHLQLTCDIEREKRLHRGRENVINCLEIIPITEHEIESFSVDLIQYTPNLIISVCGIFREPTKAYKPVRSFKRLFILAPHEETYYIVNEELFVTNATTEQYKICCKSKGEDEEILSVGHSIPEDKLEGFSKHLMIETLVQITNLDPVWALKCLQDNEWNLVEAVKVFKTLHEEKKIPEEAYC